MRSDDEEGATGSSLSDDALVEVNLIVMRLLADTMAQHRANLVTLEQLRCVAPAHAVCVGPSARHHVDQMAQMGEWASETLHTYNLRLSPPGQPTWFCDRVRHLVRLASPVAPSPECEAAEEMVDALTDGWVAMGRNVNLINAVGRTLLDQPRPST